MAGSGRAECLAIAVGSRRAERLSATGKVKRIDIPIKNEYNCGRTTRVFFGECW